METIFSSPLSITFFFFFISFFSLFHLSHTQQTYLNNAQLACYNNISSTLGYICNNTSQIQTPCSSFLFFRSTPIYNSPVLLSYLLGADPQKIAKFNNISDIDKIPNNTPIIVPVNCSCFSRFYQHNSSYVLKYTGETYLELANNTYQGLTTCQALINQNPYESTDLLGGLDILVPLRCACPSSVQISNGVKFLLTYLVVFGDDVSKIAERFGVDVQSILDANELSGTDTIFPFTPLLIPLKTEPSIDLITAIPPSTSESQPLAPSAVPVAPNVSKSKKRKWVLAGVGVGIGIGVGFLLVALLGLFLVRFSYKRQRREKPMLHFRERESRKHEIGEEKESLGNGISQGIREVVESLTVYKFEELQIATGYFSEDSRIKGSVYCGVINGDKAAVKKMKGDVSNEITILKQISHSHVVRLSGFCLTEENTYLVYEFAENGSLSDWIHDKKHLNPPLCLSWKQRVQIAYDVADGLHYLHNYANPQYIHKDLKSSNLLLDGNFRAKVANFGLARKSLENQEEDEEGGGLQMTRHIVGTQGYMAPEYLEHGLITPKLDVFALGVVLLELLSGRKAATPTNEEGKGGDLFLSASIRTVLEGENVREKLKGFIDPCLQHEYPFDLVFTMAQLAMKCVAHDPRSRPTMVDAFVSLSKILSSSLDWDPSDTSKSGSAVVLGR